MDYAERIRSLREDNDWTQTKVAKLLNVGQKTYSDYELKKIKIPVDSLILLARLYDVDLNYICGASDERKRYPRNDLVRAPSDSDLELMKQKVFLDNLIDGKK